MITADDLCTSNSGGWGLAHELLPDPRPETISGWNLFSSSGYVRPAWLQDGVDPDCRGVEAEEG